MTNPTYSSDLTERQWQLIKELLPPAKRGGRPRRVCLHATLNAMLYILVTGCQWKMLPGHFPHWRTVYGYFRAWQDDGTWERVHSKLRRWARRQAGKRVRPSAGSIDSQCIKSTAIKGERGFDSFKKVKGRKRHIIVDTLGWLLVVLITPANISDTQGAVQLLPHLSQCAHSLRCVWCDGGYFQSAFDQAQKQGLKLEPVLRPQHHKGFCLLAKRWVVERTFAWLSRCRRLAREYEERPQSSHAFILLAMTWTSPVMPDSRIRVTARSRWGF